MENIKEIPPYSTDWFKGIGDSREPAPIQDFLDDLKRQKLCFDYSTEDFLKFSDGQQTNAEAIVENYTELM